MKLAKKVLSIKEADDEIIILPPDNSAEITSAKKFNKAVNKLYNEMKSFERGYDFELMNITDIADYRMFHDAKRLIKILGMKGILDGMLDQAKGGKKFKQTKITRDKQNK